MVVGLVYIGKMIKAYKQRRAAEQPDKNWRPPWEEER
jgi:hypothetical protein